MTSRKRLKLTDRERQLLSCVLQDLTYPQAAAKLKITAHTAKTYFRDLRQKLGCATKAGLALFAANHRSQLTNVVTD